MKRLQRWLDAKAHPAVMQKADEKGWLRYEAGAMSRHWQREADVGPYPRWALPLLCDMRDTYYAWWSPSWWHHGVDRLRWACWRTAVRGGVWAVKDGDYYRNGWLQFPDMWTRFNRGNA